MKQSRGHTNCYFLSQGPPPATLDLSFPGCKMEGAGVARDESALVAGIQSVCLSVHHHPPAPPLPWGLTVRWLLEVDVGVTQRAARGHVAAHADGQDGTSGRELLVEHGLGHVRVQVAHVERGERVARAAGVHGGRAAPRSAPACAHPGGTRQRGRAGRRRSSHPRPPPALTAPAVRANRQRAQVPPPQLGFPAPHLSFLEAPGGSISAPRREAGRTLTWPRVGLRAGATDAERAALYGETWVLIPITSLSFTRFLSVILRIPSTRG